MSATADPRYPGNPSLPREVRDKILSTFRHTLNLFKESKIDDCVIGCDFILKMDPRFTPARQLMEKAKNSAADVDVAALETVVAETPTRQDRVTSVETDRLLVRAAESLNARDFEAAVTAAEGVLKLLPGNQNAMEILEKARQKKSAQPQFEVARQRAMAALDGHRVGEARAALDKMRSLDAEHPAVALLEQRLTAPAGQPAGEIGEATNPGFAPPQAGNAEPPPASALGDLSLDSLSLEEPESPAFVVPPTDFRQPTFGPLGTGRGEPAALSSAADLLGKGDSGIPPDLWGAAPEEESDGFNL